MYAVQVLLAAECLASAYLLTLWPVYTGSVYRLLAGVRALHGRRTVH